MARPVSQGGPTSSRTPESVPPGGTEKVVGHAVRVPSARSVTRVSSESAASHAARTANEGQGGGGDELHQCAACRACSEASTASSLSIVKAAVSREAKTPNVGISSIVSPGRVSSRGTTKSVKEQGNPDGDWDYWRKRVARPSQDVVPSTSSQASVGVEKARASSWAAVAASPASNHSRGPAERASPFKSRSPGRLPVPGSLGEQPLT